MSEMEKRRYQDILDAMRKAGARCYIGILNDGQDEYIVPQDKESLVLAEQYLNRNGITYSTKANGLEGDTAIWVEHLPETAEKEE